ncbi:MAG: DM13 domain-containing protein [Candidatus Limnocylindrales bacterium]|nr:DM13 domain-containing protein [Candidatus Limnocylindrales bacterium]
MNLVGDLERLFATSLYPLRVPIGIGIGIAVVGLLVVARRRGWFAAARRHPRRTGSVAVLVLALGLPVTWYLASPLIIRTQLIEPAPVAVTESASPPPSPAAPEPTTFVPTVVAAGPFRGADDFHFGEGTASIIETAPNRFTLRFEDFSVRNGPDLYVYLSPDTAGYADGVLELGTLKATDGAFGYELPDGTDPTDFASALVWCKQFAVVFAVAPLEAA